MPCCWAWAARASARRCWRRPSGSKPGFPRSARARFDRPGADARDGSSGSTSRERSSSYRASPAAPLEPNMMKDYFFDRVAQGGRRRQGRASLHRGHRSRLVAGEGGDATGLRPHLPRRAEHRRTLLGAVAVRTGAGRHDRDRRRAACSSTAGDGPLLRRATYRRPTIPPSSLGWRWASPASKAATR